MNLDDDQYRIDNLLNLQRKKNIKLSSFLDEGKKRQLFGVSEEYFPWKDNQLYKAVNNFPELEIKVGNIKIIPPNIMVTTENNNKINIKERLLPNTGIYKLKIIPVHTESTVLMLTAGGKYGKIDSIFEMIKVFQIDLTFFGKLKNIYKDGDSIKIEVDTNKSIVRCYVNNNRIEESKYNLINPLYFHFSMYKNESIKIEYFRHIYDF